MLGAPSSSRATVRSIAQTRIEQMRFTGAIPASGLRNSAGVASKSTARRAERSRATSRTSSRPPDSMRSGPSICPKGSVRSRATSSSIKGVPTLHLLYSDGIRTVSLFQNEKDAAVDLSHYHAIATNVANHPARYVEEGPTTLLAWADGNRHFALVGEFEPRANWKKSARVCYPKRVAERDLATSLVTMKPALDPREWVFCCVDRSFPHRRSAPAADVSRDRGRYDRRRARASPKSTISNTLFSSRRITLRVESDLRIGRFHRRGNCCACKTHDRCQCRQCLLSRSHLRADRSRRRSATRARGAQRAKRASSALSISRCAGRNRRAVARCCASGSARSVTSITCAIDSVSASMS